MARGPRARTAPDGLVVVDKPAGMTSHDVVSRMRRLLGTRKVGHAGTLDPMATGVLLVGVERATRLLGHLALTDKAYDATIRLGATTVTDDAEGDLLEAVGAGAVTDEEVEAALAPLRGDIEQRPSSVSAVKVDGVRSYDRVRAGEDVDLPTRAVTVSHLVVLDVRRTTLTGVLVAPDARGTEGTAAPEQGEAVSVDVVDVDVSVVCSSGTYVRALARDLGDALGVGGHLTALRRTRVGPFGLDGSHPLGDLEELVERGAAAARAAAAPGDEVERATAVSAVLPLGDVLAASYPRIDVDEATVTLVLHGVQIPVLDTFPDGLVAVFGPDGTALALAEPRGGRLTYLVVFS